MNAGTDHSRRHLANRATRVLKQHTNRQRKYVILAGAALSFLTPVAGEGMQSPRSYPLVVVRQICDEVRKCGVVHEVVQDLAAADAHLWITMPKSFAHGGCRQWPRRHQAPQCVLGPMLDRKIRYPLLIAVWDRIGSFVHRCSRQSALLSLRAT
jgi:hypothetical protein